MPDHDVRLQQLTAWLDEQLDRLFRENAWGEVPEGALTAAGYGDRATPSEFAPRILGEPSS